MKKEYSETFFGSESTSSQSVEEIKAENIKNLKEAIRLNREGNNIAEDTIHKIYQQDKSLVEGKKDLYTMNKPLRKANESLTNMDGCRCTIS
jgi:hypothetical protein